MDATRAASYLRTTKRTPTAVTTDVYEGLRFAQTQGLPLTSIDELVKALRAAGEPAAAGWVSDHPFDYAAGFFCGFTVIGMEDLVARLDLSGL